MRISDWSSDVCSSDLLQLQGDEGDERGAADALRLGAADLLGRRAREGGRREGASHPETRGAALSHPARLDRAGRGRARSLLRSEEHTSELQSLMRISYAVFCLKKKK